MKGIFQSPKTPLVMDNTNSIASKNEEVIKSFFTSYQSEAETKKQLSNFLFELSNKWIERSHEMGFTKEHVEEVSYNFHLLHDLINRLQSPY